MLFNFIIILSGIIFAKRIASLIVEHHRLLTKEVMTKIGTAYVALIFLFFVLIHPSRLAIWTMTFAPQIAFVIAMMIVRISRWKAFCGQFASLLTLLILRMKTGKSFRQSLSEVINETDHEMRSKLSEIRDLVVFSQQKIDARQPHFLQRIVREFHLADSQPHAALRRLQTFRDQLRYETDFRRRSGQVLTQTRAQALLLAGLYLAVAIFVVDRFGFARNLRFISASIVLFIAGQLWIWLGGRRFRWKV